jgi:hypothetical protein
MGFTTSFARTLIALVLVKPPCEFPTALFFPLSRILDVLPIPALMAGQLFPFFVIGQFDVIRFGLDSGATGFALPIGIQSRSFLGGVP